MNKSKKPSSKKSPAKPKQKQKEGAEKINKTNIKAETTHTQIQATNQAEQLTKVVRRSSLQQQSSKTGQNDTKKISQSNLITMANPQKSTSLLLSNNLPKKLPESNVQQTQTQVQQQSVEEVVVTSDDNTIQSKEDKEINEALQAIVQHRVSSPTIKTGKIFVKYVICNLNVWQTVLIY